MNFLAFSALLNGITATIRAILVYLRSPHDPRHKTYGLFGIAIAVWSYFYFAWQITDSKELAFLYVRLLMAGASFVPVLYLHHVLYLVNRVKQNEHLLRTSYIFAGMFLLSAFTPYLVTDLQPELSFPFWPKPGISTYSGGHF